LRSIITAVYWDQEKITRNSDMADTKKPAVQTKDLRALELKWGKQTLDVEGWTAVPNILLERQQTLKIDAVKLNILLVLLKHWWEKPKMPYPSKATIGEIVGREKSTIQKHIKQMEKQGLLKRKGRFQDAGGQTSNIYDLSGLIDQLKNLSKEELKARKERKDEDGRKRRGHAK
jgi:predicted transcriptional regulator